MRIFTLKYTDGHCKYFVLQVVNAVLHLCCPVLTINRLADIFIFCLTNLNGCCYYDEEDSGRPNVVCIYV